MLVYILVVIVAIPNLFHIITISFVVPGAVSLSVDWINKIIYWTDSQTRMIEKSNLGGSNRATFLSLGPTFPGALVVDPLNEYLFWTDVDSTAPKIERIDLDGRNRRVIVSSSLVQPFSLTIDYVDDRLFFGDKDRIESVDLDGGNRVMLSKKVVNAFALSQFEQSVFWTDLLTNKIHRVNKYTGTDFVTIIPKGVLEPYDLHIVHPLRQPLNETERNECELDTDGCEQYCINTIGSYYCDCYSGYVLNSDQTSCSGMQTRIYVYVP